LASRPNDSPAILEIGPAHNPILPRRDGYATKIVDYLDRDGLVEKYKEFKQYDPANIEEVDYVLAPGSSMHELIHERFDVVVASHVLEHTTSLIDFLRTCRRLINDQGVVALVVPDHRFCFDRFRERASLARVIDMHVDPPKVHTIGTLIEERINACKHRGTTSWAPHHVGDYELIFSPEQASARGRSAGGEYVDAHNWVFTPNHLRLLLQDLYSLGFTDLRETYFHDTVHNEFFLNLSPAGPGTGLSREEMLILSEEERCALDTPTWVVG
jgi:SAM-dependent methyltransferase